jgi:glutamate-1-semialdehyde 2,1-aminomutase
MSEIEISDMHAYHYRLNQAIPGGAHTYSRGSDQYPEIAPKILHSGQGAYVFTPSGEKYLDYGMALRSVILGYGHKQVNDAAIAEIIKGNNLSTPSTTELFAAEKIINLIPSAEMVKFAKNGSNVTSAALRLARSYTGRKIICVPRQQPFFSFEDWFIGGTVVNRGIPESHSSNTKTFDYGDISSLELLFSQFPDQIAAVMLEPATHLLPCSNSCDTVNFSPKHCKGCSKNSDNFLKQVERIAKENGAVFILDEIRSGFRWHLKGAQHIFGVQPDLTTFGKAIANGFSVAALTGSARIMNLASIDDTGAERTFLLSSTNGAEMAPLGALISTLEILESKPVSEHIWNYGDRLKKGFSVIAKNFGIEKYFELSGPSVSLEIQTKNQEGEFSYGLKTLFLQEMCRQKVLISNGNSFAQSYVHGEEELDISLHAFENALKVCAYGLEFGYNKYLQGNPVKPVFRKYN